MKAICIDDIKYDGTHFDGITKGNIYDVNFVDIDNNLIFIADDYGYKYGVHISRFKVIDE